MTAMYIHMISIVLERVRAMISTATQMKSMVKNIDRYFIGIYIVPRHTSVGYRLNFDSTLFGFRFRARFFGVGFIGLSLFSLF